MRNRYFGPVVLIIAFAALTLSCAGPAFTAEDESPIAPPPVLATASVVRANTPIPTASSSPTYTPIAPRAMQGATLPASLRPLPVHAVAGFWSSAPTIDGDLSEWTSAAYKADQIVYGHSFWTGPSDLSATFYLGWDKSNLYVAVSVTDDKFMQVSSGRQMFKGDSVEILLDSDPLGDDSIASLNGDDFQIGLSPGNFASLPPEAYRWYPESQAGPLVQVTTRAKSTANGYDLEAAVPWAIFGANGYIGRRFGFALSVSDNDLNSVAEQQSMVSNIGTRTLTDPTTWGRLGLGP